MEKVSTKKVRIEKTENLVGLVEAAKILDVSIEALIAWDADGTFKPDSRTTPGHRKYNVARLRQVKATPELRTKDKSALSE